MKNLNMINFILPNFLELSRNEALLMLKDEFAFIFNNDINIYSFYGTFPNCIWNGGRVNLDTKKYSIYEVKKIRNFYNKRGIKITFTFTNALINEHYLNDEFCNKICEIFHNDMNEILVVSPILEEYLRKKYPKYKINRSIAFADKEVPYDTDKYHLSVIDKHFNKDLEFLKKIKEKEKIELLCDEVCVNDCKYTKQHYMEISEVQLGLEQTSKNPLHGKCKYGNRVKLYNFLNFRDKNSLFYISPDDIYQKYVPLGFKYFKLSGRERYSNSGFLSIINYLIKTNYQEDIIVFLFEAMLMEADKYFRNKLEE